jgi:hypothetical protein
MIERVGTRENFVHNEGLVLKIVKENLVGFLVRLVD